MLADCQVRQGCDAGHFEVGRGDNQLRRGCCTALPAIDPDRRDSQRVSGNRIVIKAFCNMQEVISFNL